MKYNNKEHLKKVETHIAQAKKNKQLKAEEVRKEVKKLILKMDLNRDTIDLIHHLRTKI